MNVNQVLSRYWMLMKHTPRCWRNCFDCDFYPWSLRYYLFFVAGTFTLHSESCFYFRQWWQQTSVKGKIKWCCFLEIRQISCVGKLHIRSQIWSCVSCFSTMTLSFTRPWRSRKTLRGTFSTRRTKQTVSYSLCICCPGCFPLFYFVSYAHTRLQCLLSGDNSLKRFF